MGKREENARKKKIKSFLVKMVAWIILIAIITFFIIGFICKNDLFAWIWFGCDILFILWLTYFAKYFFEPPTKAYKFEVNFNNFDSIIEYLDQNVSKIGFKRYYNFDLKKAVIYYRLKQKQLSYFIIVNRDKILDNKVNTLSAIDEIKKEFVDFIYNELNENRKYIKYFEENILFAVDEENDVFKKIMNTNVFGYYDQAYIFTGYSFKTHLFYVAQQKEGYYLPYRILRSKVLKVMNLKMKDRIK